MGAYHVTIRLNKTCVKPISGSRENGKVLAGIDNLCRRQSSASPHHLSYFTVFGYLHSSMSIGISLAVRGPKEERLATMKLTTYEILVVDDQEDVRKLIVTLFTKIGHHCITAGDGFEALKQASENKIDAVITDIAMPGMDGITLVRNC